MTLIMNEFELVIVAVLTSTEKGGLNADVNCDAVRGCFASWQPGATQRRVVLRTVIDCTP